MFSYIICHPEASVQTVQSFTFTHRAIVQPPKSNYFRNKHKNTHHLRFNVSDCEYCTSSRHNDRRDQPKFPSSWHHRSPAIDYWQTKRTYTHTSFNVHTHTHTSLSHKDDLLARLPRLWTLRPSTLVLIISDDAKLVQQAINPIHPILKHPRVPMPFLFTIIC